MSIDRDELFADLISITSRYVGRTDIDITLQICAGLGICGGDALEYYRELERRFSVDLRSITEVEADHKSRIFGREQIISIGTDPSILEIGDYILDYRLR